jgi:hypothetical protein
MAWRRLVAGEAASAERLLLGAIERFPFDGLAWLDLAEARLKSGELQAVEAAVRNASLLGPTKGKWHWRAAKVLLEAGRGQAALEELAAVARVDRSRRRQAWDLAWLVFQDPRVIRERLVPPDAASRLEYLFYLVARRKAKEALAVWQEASARATLAERLAFVDFLLSAGEIEKAWEIWVEGFPQAKVATVYNGDFRHPPLQHGFGWKIGGEKGVRVRLSRRGGSGLLQIDFQGGNPAFDHAFQLLKVEGGKKYRLSAFVTWSGITSASPPVLYVRGGYGCGRLWAQSKGLGGSGYGEVVVKFETPPRCETVFAGIMRRPTRKLDRFIRGKVEVDMVALTGSARSSAVAEGAL